MTLILVLLGVAAQAVDTTSTVLALHLGLAHEANPLLVALINQFGLAGLVAVKFGLVAVICRLVLSESTVIRHRTLLAAALFGAGLLADVVNLSKLLSL